MIAQLGAEDQAFRDIMDGKFENIDEIANTIKNLNSTDPDYIRIIDKLNAMQAYMDDAKATTSGGVNPQTTDKPVVATYDSEGAAGLLSQLQDLGNQTGNQGFMDLVTDVIEGFDALGDVFSDDDDDKEKGST